MATDTPVSELQEQVESPLAPARARGAVKGEDEISLLDLLIVLAEAKAHHPLGDGGFAILAIIVSLLLPMRYTATVTLLPPQQNSSLSAQLASQFGSLGGMAALAAGGSGLLKNPNDMYVAMLRSRTVEDAMVQHFGLMQEYHKRYLSDARKKFEQLCNRGRQRQGRTDPHLGRRSTIRAAPPNWPTATSISSAICLRASGHHRGRAAQACSSSSS